MFMLGWKEFGMQHACRNPLLPESVRYLQAEQEGVTSVAMEGGGVLLGRSEMELQI
jgi:hypothetical protein